MLTSLRVLFSLTYTSTFLADFHPQAINLLVRSWPNSRIGSIKGKEIFDVNQEKILLATLEVAVKAIENPVDTFMKVSIESILVKVILEFGTRLIQGESINEMAATSRIDVAIAKIIAILFDLGSNKDLIGGTGKLQQILAATIMENGTRMVDSLIGRDVSIGLKVGRFLYSLARFCVNDY